MEFHFYEHIPLLRRACQHESEYTNMWKHLLDEKNKKTVDLLFTFV